MSDRRVNLCRECSGGGDAYSGISSRICGREGGALLLFGPGKKRPWLTQVWHTKYFLYINSFYFGLFATCELGTLILKSILIGNKQNTDSYWTTVGRDYGVLMGLFVVEGARLILGRRGSLSDRDIPVMFSVILTVPSIGGVLYLLKWQVVVLRIEYIWCTLMLTVQVLEFIYASMFIVTMCRGPSYD